MTAVVEPILFGKQTPRIRSVPRCDVSLGDKAIEFAAKAGLYLDPWQQLVLRDSLGVLKGGRWAASQVGLLVPRQNGKGAVLEALELFHMFVLKTPLIVHSAHKFDTSQEHFLRLRLLIEANAHLSKHVRAMPTSQGHEAIILTNGNRLKFKARTVGGAGRGFSADLLVLDEAMLLPDKALNAMLPTLTARKNPQVWFTSSAGDEDSTALWRIVKRGRAGSARMAYAEWGCSPDVDPLDRDNWADANPGLGYRLGVDALEDDLALLSEDGFAKEHLGIWDEMAASGIFAPGAWEALADPNEPQGPAPAFGIATAPDRSWCAISAAWRRSDGGTQVSLVDYHAGTAWVTDRHRELKARWGGVFLADTASRGLVDDAMEPSQTEQAKAHNALSDAVESGALHHPDEAALNVSVRAARWRPLGDTRVLDARGSVDISPLRAASLAVHGLTVAAPSVYEERGLITL